MASSAQNKLMTNIGPGTPAGNVLRSFWQPVALAEELNNDRPVAAVQVFGESLVLFRDQDGNLGLLDRNCAHRGADLCYGRLEDNGIRCPFHGWLFSTNGDCMEQPAEPEDSTLRHRVQQKSYPAIEKNGMIFAFMGKGDIPPLPNLDCLIAPSTHNFCVQGIRRLQLAATARSWD